MTISKKQSDYRAQLIDRATQAVMDYHAAQQKVNDAADKVARLKAELAKLNEVEGRDS